MSTNSATFTLAVDASWLRTGGIARMAKEILIRKPAGVRIVEIREDRANAGVLTPLDLALKARAVSADAVWSPGFMPPLFKVANKPVFITIHDLTHLHLYTRLHRLYYDNIIKNLLRNVDCILTGSEYSRQEILQWSGIEDDRVVRIHYGVSDDFRLDVKSSAAGARYILYVGNRRKNKNLDRLISAFSRSGLALQGFQLWLTGIDDEGTSAVVAREGVSDSVKYVGSVSDQELINLYRGAHALAFVSLYEGFGLPVVEAMACGCPVLTSNTTSLGEVAGDAALTVNPEDVDAIASGLSRICHDTKLRSELRSAGLERVTAFRWDACAEQFWQTFMNN